MTKDLNIKRLLNFTIVLCYLYNDALSGPVAPRAAKEIHVKVYYSIFSQKFNLRSKYMFSYIYVLQVPPEMEMFKT